MAEEAVIFPPQSLFMVDRGWQRRKKKGGAKDSPFTEHELDLQASRVPEITITVAKGSGDTRSTSPPETKNEQAQARSNSQQSGSIQFMTYEPQKLNRRRQQGLKDRKQAKQSDKGRTSCPSDAVGHAAIQKDVFTLKQSLPGTATALFPVVDPEVGCFQEYLSYYPTRLAAAMYPISKSVPLTYNPIKSVWYPAVVKDEVSLHAVLFSCAMHYFNGSGYQTFRGSEAMMKVILNGLNRRLKEKKYSDLTIGSISCLATCENHLGNHNKWKMHAVGMAEMVRERGGFENVQDLLHMKIYKADTIGSVDTLSHPHFPRPIRRTESLHTTLALDTPSPPIKALLVDLGLTRTVLDALVELSCLCHALDRASESQTPIDPMAMDEDMTCIQHDLLRSLHPEQTGVERLCVITALIFIQTLTREIPFTRLCSSYLSKQLKVAFPAIDVAKAPASLIFWMLFMGGLVSSDTAEKVWFRNRLREFQQLRGDLLTWERGRAQLQKVFWVESLHEDIGLQLWEDFDSLNRQ